MGPVVPPFLDRRILESGDMPLDFKFDPTVLRRPPTLVGAEDSMEQRKKPIGVAFLNLSKLQIEKLKNKANMDLDMNRNVRGYSRFEAVAAHLWRCMSKARGHVSEQTNKPPLCRRFQEQDETSLAKKLLRKRPNPGRGHRHFRPLTLQLFRHGLKEIREAVEKVTDSTVRAYLDYLKDLSDVGTFRSLDNNGRPKGDFYSNPNLAIISWASLPLYGSDFGWGSEIHLGHGPMGFDGKTFIIPSREGDGSFNVAIWLQEEHMTAFKKCFYDDI